MRILVTGGNGFLGRAIVRRLVKLGHSVTTLARHSHPELSSLGVEQVLGSISDPKFANLALQDQDAVIHTAAKAGVWGNKNEYEETNVKGTRVILQAAIDHKVTRFVYTSSPSVVFDGHDAPNLSEEQAKYPATYLTDYSRTKAIAEREVLEANGKGISTVALRPHLIWGPGDPHLLPRLWGRAIAGKLRLIGPGTNRIDTTHVENAALAHVLAVEQLGPGSTCAGKAYFVTNGEPLAIKDLFSRFLEAAGIDPKIPSVSPRVARVVAYVSERWARLTGQKSEPLLTRFVVDQLASEHWFCLDRIRKDLGYEPVINTEKGLQGLTQWLQSVKESESSSALSVGS